MTLTYAEIAEIIKLIDASSCEEITLDLGDIKLSMRRHGGGGPATTTAAPAVAEESGDAGAKPGPPAEPPLADGVLPTAASSRTQASATAGSGMSEIRSPMVGTFYRAPSPTLPPFVEVGSAVAEDDPLCLIEVMKLYTTISATGPGRVAEIRAENGAMVEADEVLFLIEPL